MIAITALVLWAGFYWAGAVLWAAVSRLEDQLAEARQKNEDLEAALLLYGKHGNDCLEGVAFGGAPVDACTCYLSRIVK